MESHISTTPFGRRAMSLGMIASQIAARTMPADATVHKWHVFDDIKKARIAVGATDRDLAVLNALLSFKTETALYGDGDLIVFPSNEALADRANGMSPATLRRHLASLVECGLVIRRDSPNGKRFARKGQGGEIEQAYGFDLSPIVARAVEFKQLAEAVKAEKKALRLAKDRLTICRRDIRKLIITGIEEGVPANWARVQDTYQAIIARLPRTASRQMIEAIAGELEELWSEIREVLESFVISKNLSANESQTERHLQNSKADSKSESESGWGIEEEARGDTETADNVRSLPKREMPLNMVMEACPNLAWLVKGGEKIRTWHDFLAAAEVARPTLGISPSAWDDARVAMGETEAAIAIAAIYQRADQINSAGGYLRNLTEKAKAGKFSVWPMVMALVRARLEAAKASGSGGGEGAVELETAAKVMRTEQRLDISDSLRRSLGADRHKR